ncbi:MULTISPECIES: type VI secretion system protein TssA [unclassified Vibrio]|uniref:type VI secretion system protein TssA n=1 Tax=unclassified Vibrio TaxID=2614977 RepID=UPI0013612585|nr:MULTISPECIES: type VI secretion system ImpA family N-terminal domain-containing protein [unclassified Vibrio]NAW57741.1 type VI secretion protein [Vibrio sp. V36_P2S2PM302]NAX28043.1 type VI secretion protein [Vibrio sp. V38_P2S17PM301]NAX30226.1 type VI secretion protein [Vibrio sp. V37_P2S8PM304]
MPFSKQNIEQLVVPIASDAVCGRYLKLDKSAFRPLRNEFNVAQTALRKLSQNPSEDELEDLQKACLASWQTLAESLLNQFETTTRDIELIAWFIAAQILLDSSLNSAANVLQWLAELAEQHWASLHPVLPEEKLKSTEPDQQQREQADAKVKAFFQLNGDSEESSIVYAPLLQQVLVGNVSFYDYQSAERKGEVNQLKAQVSAMALQQRAEIQQRMDNTVRCIEQVERLASVVSQHTQNVGVSAANFGFVKALFQRLEHALHQLTGVKPTPKTTSAPTAVTSEQPENRVPSGADDGLTPYQAAQSYVVSGAPLSLSAGNLAQIATTNNMNRDLAFHLLREVSDYFRQSEPHSPVSFLLEKAIRWGYLPLPELLQEMMAEQGGDTLSKIFNAAGLNHLDQVTLPDVEMPAVDIENTSVPEKAPPVTESMSIEEHVSQTSTADTQSQQQSESHEPAGSTALRW